MDLTISLAEDVRRVLEQRAKARGEDMKTFVENLLRATATQSVDEFRGPAPTSDAEFEGAMEAFAEGTEHLPANSDTYSQADIYSDCD